MRYFTIKILSKYYTKITRRNILKKYFEEILTENGYLAYNNTDYIAICF